MTRVSHNEADYGGQRSGSASGVPDGGNDDDAFECDLDDVFDVLADHRRRDLLSILLDADETLPVDALATAVLAREAERPPSELPERDTSRAAVSLLHVHLPKLESLGFVEYEAHEGERTLVRLTDAERVRTTITQSVTAVEQITHDTD